MTTARKTPWIMIAVLALVAAAASSAGMYLFMKNQLLSNQAGINGGAPHSADSEPDKPPRAPLLVNISPMTVNLQNERNEPSLLYVGFALEVGDESTQTFLQQYLPQIRSRILTLLSGQDSTQLIRAEGKAALSARILETLKQPLDARQPRLALLNVLYTDFIVQ